MDEVLTEFIENDEMKCAVTAICRRRRVLPRPVRQQLAMAV